MSAPARKLPANETEAMTVTVPEAARLLAISRSHAYELCARGDLPSVRLGRRIVVPIRPLLAMLNNEAAPGDGQDPEPVRLVHFR